MFERCELYLYPATNFFFFTISFVLDREYAHFSTNPVSDERIENSFYVLVIFLSEKNVPD